MQYAHGSPRSQVVKELKRFKIPACTAAAACYRHTPHERNDMYALILCGLGCPHALAAQIADLVTLPFLPVTCGVPLPRRPHRLAASCP